MEGSDQDPNRNSGTPRPLGGLVKTAEWSEENVREGFRSETGLTPNVFPWIIEEAVKDHPGNTLHTMQGAEIDSYGRLHECGQVNMLFSYTSDEEHDYEQVHFIFERKNMVTSISYKQESDEFNGYLVRRIRAGKRNHRGRFNLTGWECASAHKWLHNSTPTRRVDYSYLGWVLGVGSLWISASVLGTRAVLSCLLGHARTLVTLLYSAGSTSREQ
eukprot:6228422-Amphidinium_carterae.3